MTTTPKIYVASLADYNAGRLHGIWIDATDEHMIHEAVKEMLSKSKEPFAEEWAIHDYEAFGSHKLGEWESFEEVAKIACAIDDHGEPYLAYLAWADEPSVADFEDRYRGSYESEKEFAWEYFESMDTDLGPLASYIDWEHVWNGSLRFDFHGEWAGGDFHVFWSS
tara:strand:- start:4038 stop:4535 length:498 start_codon:yes stop_codon:yes gene_type:complete